MEKYPALSRAPGARVSIPEEVDNARALIAKQSCRPVSGERSIAGIVGALSVLCRFSGLPLEVEPRAQCALRASMEKDGKRPTGVCTLVASLRANKYPRKV